MPVAPYTWQTNDFLTANRLNGELRQVNAQPYLANGVGFHAQRPVYKSYLTAGTTQVPSGGWQQQYDTAAGLGSWTPVIDTAAFLGGRGDLAAQGGYLPSGLTSGGGLVGSVGGLQMFWTYQPFLAQASGMAQSGVGFIGGASPNVVGTLTPYNGNTTTPWAAGILDGGTGSRLTGYYNGVGVASYVSAAGDGSGSPPLQMSFWASVYPANGTKVLSIPAITTGYTGASALTSAGLNAQIQQAMRLLNMPPLLEVQAAAGTSCPAGTQTVINYSSAAFDTYGGWTSGAAAKYTVPLAGLYLVTAFSGFDTMPANGYVRNGVLINGTLYAGPLSQGISGTFCNSSKVQIFSLNAGDTIQHVVQQGTASTISTSTSNAASMQILWLGASGAPGVLPSVPDFTYQFAAGTPGSQMPAVLNANLANDLQFLLQKPYVLAWQNAAQTAFANRSNTALNLQVNTGIVHGDSAASYGGWNGSSTYTAPVSGWYLCVEEFYMATPPTGTCQAQGTFGLTPAGAGVDYYENKSMVVGNGSGASAMSLYYLRAGDAIQPMAYWAGNTSTLATYSTAPYFSHFEAVWLSA